MEILKKIIKKELLEKFYQNLKRESSVYAPVIEKSKVEYKFNPEYNEVTYDYIQTVQSPKNVVFPKTENLFHFKKNNREAEVEDVDISKISDVIVWGVHPCDIRLFEILKSIFVLDYKDVFFQTRMEKLILIGLSCHKSDSYCFCTSVGIGPGETKGSDILLTKISDDYFLAEIVSEKGKKIFEKNSQFFEDAKDVSKEKNIADVPVYFNSDDVIKVLPEMFNNNFWVRNSLRCIGCGACTFVCPTCGCFDIQDETKRKCGSRVRCWDSCGFSMFTIHASGHNPRALQSQRWRQRIMHKYSYQPQNSNLIGCVGCGRCSRACSADMNILEQLIEISKMKDKI